MSNETSTDALRLVPDDQLAALIEQADAGFGYSMEMVRLVDGVRTYRLKIEGQETVEITDGEDNDYESIEACYALVKAAKNKVRADAIRTALAAPASPLPEGGGLEPLANDPAVAALCDSSYRAGALAGWNAANHSDPAEGERIMARIREVEPGSLAPILERSRLRKLPAAPTGAK